MSLPTSSSLRSPSDALLALLPEVVSDVTEQMFFGWAESCDATRFEELLRDAAPEPTSPWLQADVAFHGSVDGSLRLTIPAELARTLVAAMMGEDDAHPFTPELCADISGELANMICGAVLTRGDRTHACELRPPVVMWMARPAADAVDPHADAVFSVNERPMIIRIAVRTP